MRLKYAAWKVIGVTSGAAAVAAILRSTVSPRVSAAFVLCVGPAAFALDFVVRARRRTPWVQPPTAHVTSCRAQVSEFVQRVMYLDPEEYYLTDECTIQNLQRGHRNEEYLRFALGVKAL